MDARGAFPQEIQEMLDGPYWRVVIRPTLFEAHRVPYAELNPLLERTRVRLRGWDFPHLTNRSNEIVRGDNYVGAWSIFANYEYWRFYESAQLIHFHGVREVVDTSYREKVERVTRSSLDWRHIDWDTVPGIIEIINFVYTVTEIFEFASRLMAALRLQSPMHIEIALRNIQGFILGISDMGRAWHEFYQWNGAPVLAHEWNIDADDLIAHADASSLAAVTWFFERFGWLSVNADALRDAQVSLLRRR